MGIAVLEKAIEEAIEIQIGRKLTQMERSILTVGLKAGRLPLSTH